MLKNSQNSKKRIVNVKKIRKIDGFSNHLLKLLAHRLQCQ